MKARIHFKRGMWRVKTCKRDYYSPCIIVEGNWHTECKPNKRRNPRGFVICKLEQISFFDALPPDLTNSRHKLCYDLKGRKFDVTGGQNGIVFTAKGAFYK
jgi:hypothetical protein